MKLLLAPALLLAALSTAFAQTAGTPQHRQAELRGSMEHWVLMARPDAADPSIKALAEELTDLHERATQTNISELSVSQLETDFTGWKERFARLCFDRRPEGAPNDYGIYRKQLESGIGGLAAEQKAAQAQPQGPRPASVNGAAATKQLGALKRLVDPTAFSWYVERSQAGGGTASIPGWAPPSGGRTANASLPAGWTQNGGGTASDLQTGAPPEVDPKIAAQTTKAGEYLWKHGGTVESCYAGVKALLMKMGVVSTFWGKDKDGRVVTNEEVVPAYQFDRWVQNHPTLQKRKLIRVAEPAWPLDISNIVVWGPGVCGYNDTYGHIEMIYKLSPDKRQAWSVSDHSQQFAVDCFKREAEKSNEARASLPALREAVTQAQAELGGISARKASTLARAALGKKKAALAHAERAADSVSVYLISREAK